MTANMDRALAPGATPPDADAAAAHQFRILAAPTRLRILRLLAGAPAPLSVGEVASAVGLAHSTASHHLRRLAGVGLVDVRRAGRLGLATLDPAAVDRVPILAALIGGPGAPAETGSRAPADPRVTRAPAARSGTTP